MTTPDSLPLLAAVDLVALGLLAAGAVLGAIRGLGPVFVLLLWLVVALWLGSVLTPVVLGWMPNSGGPSDPEASFAAFGLITGLVLMLPLVARLLGGAGGKKRADPEAHYRLSGALVGVIVAVLLVTLLAPYGRRVTPLTRAYPGARTPALALSVAEWVRWLYPVAFRDELWAAAHGEPPPAPPETPALENPER